MIWTALRLLFEKYVSLKCKTSAQFSEPTSNRTEGNVFQQALRDTRPPFCWWLQHENGIGSEMQLAGKHVYECEGTRVYVIFERG